MQSSSCLKLSACHVSMLQAFSRLDTVDFLQMLRAGDFPAAAAQEVLEVFAPLADQLGVWSLKAELEDLAFQVCSRPVEFLVCVCMATLPNKNLPESRSSLMAYCEPSCTDLQPVLCLNSCKFACCLWYAPLFFTCLQTTASQLLLQALHPKEHAELRAGLQDNLQSAGIEHSLETLKVCLQPSSYSARSSC